MVQTMGSKRKVVIEVSRLVMEIGGDFASNGLDQRDLIVFPDSVLELSKEFVDGQGLFG
jgi:hypothetical protein